MNTKRLGMIILIVGLIAAGLIGSQTLAVSSAKAAVSSPVGSWRVVVTPDGGPSFVDGIIFSSDGTMTAMENDGRLGLGVWEKTSGSKYAFTFWEYYDEGGASLQVSIRSTIELSADKEQYDGPFFVQVLDSDGNVLAEGTGTATGFRNHVEPMP